MTHTIEPPAIDLAELRKAIHDEYALVAEQPEHGFHFQVGRPLAHLLGYRGEWLTGIPEPTIGSFAGTGNPFSVEELREGEHVVDVGCGGGIDSLIAARMVGPSGRVIGVDMTPAMLAKARASATAAGMANVDFREGFGEGLPIEDAWADVVISNGVLNLMPDKDGALRENGAHTQTGWPAPGRRHRGPESRAAQRETRHRAVDRLNRWCSPGRRARTGSDRRGICRLRD
jgi:SAM-dependent methyltransferase